MPEELTGAHRTYLKGLAQRLKPAVFIGKKGFTETAAEEIDSALERHELIKVKILGEREARDAICEDIEFQNRCECVGQIGGMAIFFRQHIDPQKQHIELP